MPKDSLLRFWLVVAQLQTLPTDHLHQMLYQGKKETSALRRENLRLIRWFVFVCVTEIDEDPVGPV